MPRRLVSAAPFRDRVVHHALIHTVGPIFERGFIHHSYANRVGTHRAVAQYEQGRDRHAWVLRADIWRYFPAIDHAVLKANLRRRLRCARTLALCDHIIDASNPQEPVDAYFPGDDLFTPFERRRGLPLGNLTSQFFVNVYLDPLDHWATEVLRAPYLRYVDDTALFADVPAKLQAGQARMAQWLAVRRLLLTGDLDVSNVRQQIGVWLADARHAHPAVLRNALLREAWFDPFWADRRAVTMPRP